MKRIMAVYDVDPFYADKFAEFTNQRETLPFTAVAFTSLERLRAYTQRQQIEILLVGAEVADEELEDIRTGQVIRLGDGGMAGPQESPVVYKYQSSDNVLREVMACYQTQSEPMSFPAREMMCSITGVYSPVNRCGKTGFCLTMGQIMAKEQKVLYLNLEENSGLSQLTGTVYKSSLSDLLYYFKQGEYSRLRLNAVLYTLGGMDYVAPAAYAEDLAQVQPQDLKRLIQQIAADGEHDVILLDLGRLGWGAENLLEICTQIYVPTLEDCVSAAKLEEWKRYLENSGRGSLTERMRWVKLPGQNITGPAESYLERLLWGEMGDYVRGMLKGKITTWTH